MSAFRDLLLRHSSSMCRLDALQVSRLEQHYQLLWRWNQRLNLTSVTDLEDLVKFHYCESLALGASLPPGSLSVVDIGSGAGFPGVPAAILRPECGFTLVESKQKKAVFLREVSRELSNVQVIADRAENLAGTFDWLISRAVKLEPVFLRLARHVALLHCDGTLPETVSWQESRKLPFGERRVIAIGCAT